MSGARWRLDVAGLTDTGQKREVNEDAYAIDCENALFVVADGMGGHVAGAEASKLVVDLLPRMWLERSAMLDDDPSARDVSQGLRDAMGAIGTAFRQRAAELSLQGMGSTVVMLLFDGMRLHVGWGGDSRAYRLRHGKLQQLTIDHTMVGALLRDGAIDAETAAKHPARNKLVNYVGMRGAGFEPEVKVCDVALDDRFLLCSDGLTGEVEDEEIRAVLLSGVDARTACRSLVARANAAGGRDNITAVVIDVSRTG